VHFDSDAGHVGAQAGDGGLAFVSVASNEHEPGAERAESRGGLKPDPARRAADNTGFSSHVAAHREHREKHNSLWHPLTSCIPLSLPNNEAFSFDPRITLAKHFGALVTLRSCVTRGGPGPSR
jgi:hypothetical protein